MNHEKAKRVLNEGCELLLDSLEMALEENKKRGVVDQNHAPLVRDLMIALEKDMRAKTLLRELGENEDEQGALRAGGYSRAYMADGNGGEYGQPRRANGRWMDDGNNNNMYSTYGHDDTKSELRRVIEHTTDPAVRRTLEEAMHSI